MALWQYQLFLVPEEEVASYFKNDVSISQNAFNEIGWWRYRQLGIASFYFFEEILPVNESWSKDIILFGNESSNCIELLINRNLITEVCVRIDLRVDYKQLLHLLCEFSNKNNCILLNSDLKMIRPDFQRVEADIISYPRYKSFVEKLNSRKN
jgi:hypothetical protein